MSEPLQLDVLRDDVLFVRAALKVDCVRAIGVCSAHLAGEPAGPSVRAGDHERSGSDAAHGRVARRGWRCDGRTGPHSQIWVESGAFEELVCVRTGLLTGSGGRRGHVEVA